MGGRCGHIMAETCSDMIYYDAPIPRSPDPLPPIRSSSPRSLSLLELPRFPDPVDNLPPSPAPVGVCPM